MNFVNNYKFFLKNGFCIYSSSSIEKKIQICKKIYQNFYLSKFSKKNKIRNFNICKNFSRDPSVTNIFIDKNFINFLKKISISKPIRSSPVFSHLLTYNQFSKSQILPFHQDWTSLATSMNGVVTWFNFSNKSSSLMNGLEFSLNFKKKILKGKVEKNVFRINESELNTIKTLKVYPKNGILIFSTFLPHRTISFVNKKDKNFWRMGISTRFDNLSCKIWNKNNFPNAYSNVVNRKLFKKFI